MGKRIFSGNCVSCHQADGKGLPGQYPTLNGSEWVAGNPAWMKRIVLNGLEGPITVKGANYNNAMPALGAKLTDKQIAAVITFVRTNAEWGNTATQVTADSVAATRAAVKGRTSPWAPAELQMVTADEQPAPGLPGGWAARWPPGHAGAASGSGHHCARTAGVCTGCQQVVFQKRRQYRCYSSRCSIRGSLTV